MCRPPIGTFLLLPAHSDYASLPTVAFVIPNLDNDMHDGTIAQGDAWLNNNLSAYAAWAKGNNSLLVVTWDEAENSESNQIPTIFFGANVRTGSTWRAGQPLQRAVHAGRVLRPEHNR